VIYPSLSSNSRCRPVRFSANSAGSAQNAWTCSSDGGAPEVERNAPQNFGVAHSSAGSVFIFLEFFVAFSHVEVIELGVSNPRRPGRSPARDRIGGATPLKRTRIASRPAGNDRHALFPGTLVTVATLTVAAAEHGIEVTSRLRAARVMRDDDRT